MTRYRRLGAAVVLSAVLMGSFAGASSAAFISYDSHERMLPNMLHDGLTKERLDALQWAERSDLLSMEADVNQPVTYAHLAKMLTVLIHGEALDADDMHWSDSSFRYLESYDTILTNGWEEKRNKQVTRGEFAAIIGKMIGGKQELSDSIRFLHETGLTQGDYSRQSLYDSYGSGKSMTRAQTAIFLKRIDDRFQKELRLPKQLEELSAAVQSSVGKIHAMEEDELKELGRAVVFAAANLDIERIRHLPTDRLLGELFGNRQTEQPTMSVKRLLSTAGSFSNLAAEQEQNMLAKGAS